MDLIGELVTVRGRLNELAAYARDPAIDDVAIQVSRLSRELQAEIIQARMTPVRSEEHTSELQSQSNLVCRLLLEKKKQDTSDKDPSRDACPCNAPTSSSTAHHCCLPARWPSRESCVAPSAYDCQAAI